MTIALAASDAGAAVDKVPRQSMSQSPSWDGIREWLEKNLLSPDAPPFSFIYDGKNSRELLAGWERSQSTKKLNDNQTQHVVKYVDPTTKLEVRCEAIVYGDYPAVDWVLRLKNTGQRDTPIISEIHALDSTLESEVGECTLHHGKGVQEGIDAQLDDFSPQSRTLEPHSEFTISPLHGRSSWGGSLPFFNLEFTNQDQLSRGVVLGIGWSGQWFAKFRREPESLTMRAGMAVTHLKLHLGEEIRTPKIMLLFWQGHRFYGQNLLRRMILAHYHPQRDGKPLTMPFLASSAGLYEEAMKATEQNQIDFAEKFAPLGVEYLWIDVGWHVINPTSHIGPADPSRFPGGLRRLSDALKKLNMGLLVWMAPEFQGGGSWMERDRPELFLTVKDDAVADHPLFKILDFGNKEALQLVTDHVSDLIQKEGIAIYRQDGPVGANLETSPGTSYPDKQPLRWWRDADAPDRKGISEIRYVEGMYWFWDELQKRNPGLIIDLCGGGATRIDLEAMSRGVYLWRSDYNHPGFEPTGHQSMTYGVSPWVPSTMTGSGYPDPYSFRSSITNGVVLAWNPYQPAVTQNWPLAFPVKQRAPYELKTVSRTTVDGKKRVGYMVSEPFPWETAKRLTAEFKRIRHYFYGDFYPLTTYSTSNKAWMAYQFHDEVAGEGLALAFRRPECSSRSTRLRLWGLLPDANYEVHFSDIAAQQTMSGKELIEGLKVTIEDQPGSELITYRQIH